MGRSACHTIIGIPVDKNEISNIVKWQVTMEAWNPRSLKP